MISENHNDDMLLEALRNDNSKAFEEIFNRYWYDLLKLACAKTRSREEGEEIVQEIFTNLWKNRHSLLISNLSFYLYAAVRKRVISNVRSKIVHQKYWDYYSQFISEKSFNTDEAVEYAALDEAIEGALRQLPEKSQQIFRLNRLQGYSITEISENMKIPKRTIEHYLTKSLRQLRLHLKDYILILFVILGTR